MSRALSVWLAILFLFVGFMFTFYSYKQSRNSWGTASEPDATSDTRLASLEAGEFTLTDQNGEKFNSKSLQGKVWLGNFFFARCAGQCPAQNRQLSLLHFDYAPQGLEIVSITCDPPNDTPSALLKYSKNYNADADTWHFLTDPNFEYIKSIANEFFLAPLEQLTHADQVYLFGRDGKLIKNYGIIDSDTYREIEADIQTALADDGATSDEETTGTDGRESV